MKSLIILAALLSTSLFASEHVFYGEVTCSKGCYLIQDKETLSEVRFQLFSSDGKKALTKSPFDKNFVKIIGARDKKRLRVIGITLGPVDHRFLSKGGK